MGVIDIIIIGLFLIFAIVGYIRGFTKQFLSSIAWLVALVIAGVFCKQVAEMVDGIDVVLRVEKTIYNWFASKGETFTTVVPSVDEAHLSDALTVLGIPQFLHSIIIGKVNLDGLVNTSIAGFLTPKIMYFVSTAISFVLLYIVTFILVKLISKILGGAVRGSALGIIDGALGFIWGLVKSGILVSTAMLLLSLVISLPYLQTASEWIANDMHLNDDVMSISKFIYLNNPLIFIFSKISFN